MLFMPRLPIAPFERILKESEKNIRVSQPAAVAFTEFIEEFSKELAREIAEIARHANRKTILDGDVKIIVKRVGKK